MNVQLIGPAEAVPLLQSPIRGIFQHAVKSCPFKARSRRRGSWPHRRCLAALEVAGSTAGAWWAFRDSNLSRFAGVDTRSTAGLETGGTGCVGFGAEGVIGRTAGAGGRSGTRT